MKASSVFVALLLIVHTGCATWFKQAYVWTYDQIEGEEESK
jgi:hypothetical protein